MSIAAPAFARIEDFLDRTGMSRGDFGVQAMGDWSFVQRCETGHDFRVSTLDFALSQIEHFDRTGSFMPRTRRAA